MPRDVELEDHESLIQEGSEVFKNVEVTMNGRVIPGVVAVVFNTEKLMERMMNPAEQKVCLIDKEEEQACAGLAASTEEKPGDLTKPCWGWSKEQEAYLKKAYPAEEQRVMEKTLDKSWNTIKVKAHKMEIHRKA